MSETAPSSELVLVVTTAPDAEVAETLVRNLLEERLIACANLLPGLTSVFRWQERVEREPEVLILMKTARTRVEPLFERISQLHPYDVPEMVALSVEAVSRAYCEWVQQETLEVSA